MEHQSLLKELNSLIEYYSKRTDCPPTRIRIGYRAYAKLMQNLKFADEVSNSALDPNKRKYKKLKIKVTKDDDQLELE
jgi:hypothetical protein